MNISVIPNPTNGKVTISGIEVSSVEVYNLVGEKIYSSTDGSGIIDLSSRPDGIYFITAKSGNDIYYQKTDKTVTGISPPGFILLSNASLKMSDVIAMPV